MRPLPTTLKAPQTLQHIVHLVSHLAPVGVTAENNGECWMSCHNRY